MSITLDKIIAASKKIQDAITPEKIVVLGINAYTELHSHISVTPVSPGMFVNKIGGLECHLSFVIGSMSFMILTREEFEKFKEEEKDFLSDKIIQEEIPLYIVPKNVFRKFLDQHRLNETQGKLTHSTEYKNSKGETHAYMETSSWGMLAIYKVSDSTFQNYEALSFMNNKLNTLNPASEEDI